MHLLVEICLPFQNGIEVIGPVWALFGADYRHPDHVAQNLFQRLPMFFIHGEQKEGQQHDHHAHGRRAGSRWSFQKKKQRYAKKRAPTEADQLPAGEIECDLGFDFG